MTVQSFTYILFIPLVWLAWRLIPFPMPRKIVLLCCSYLFYATWGISFLAILILSSVANYGFGEYLRRRPDKSRLCWGIGFNVVILAVFKYLPAVSFTQQSSLTSKLFVPIGVSFWTFQALSYLFDLYREEDLDPSLLEFCLYMAFWPTVLSGPVCRLPEMLPQFRNFHVCWDDVAEGCKRLLIGLFMKVVLAQILASGLQAGEGVNAGFDQFSGWGGLDVWALAFGYGFQLFFDFAGYSNIVIGTARLFGIRLAENFDHPYLSATPSEFWTRWHMSLSFWIRDYVFLPLAMLRNSLAWRYGALLFAMILFGFWHGATVLYLLWGAYHGVLLVGHRALQHLSRRVAVGTAQGWSHLFSWSITFPLMCLGWILFRANSLGQAFHMFGAVLHPATYQHLALKANFYLITAIMISGYFAVCGYRWFAERWGQSPLWKRTAWILSPVIYSLLIVGVIVWSKQKSVFVYMQF